MPRHEIGIVAATPAAVSRAIQSQRSRDEFFHLGDEPMHIFVMPLDANGRTLGAIGILHDVAFLGIRMRHSLGILQARRLPA